MDTVTEQRGWLDINLEPAVPVQGWNQRVLSAIKYRNFFALTPLTGPCVLHFHEFFPVIIFAYCNFVLHYLQLDMNLTFEGEKFPQRVKER